MVVCRTIQAFPTSPSPVNALPSVLVAGLPPAFLSRRFRVYLRRPRISFESPLWYDRRIAELRSGRRVPYHRDTGRFLPPFHPSGGSALRVSRRPCSSALRLPNPVLASFAFRLRSASQLPEAFRRSRPRGRWVSCNGGLKLRLSLSRVKGVVDQLIHKS